MLFFLKKAVSRFLFPVPLVLLLLCGGLLVWRFTRRKRLGMGLLLGGVVLLIAFSSSSVSSGLLSPLEKKYPPLVIENRAAAGLSGPVDIVVLGQGFQQGAGFPASSQVGGSQLARIMEAVRLHRLLPGSRILLSIGGVNPEAREDLFIREFAKIVAVEPGAIVKISGARDTRQEMQLAASLVQSNQVILVTSASHMPRAMLIAAKAGLHPLAAPCDYSTGDPEIDKAANWSPADLFPSSGGLGRSERAIYEYLGLASEKITSK